MQALQRHDPHQNHLLDALPPEEYRHLLPDLELVPMLLGHVLHDSGGKMRHGYFPTTAIVSRLYILADGASAETAVIGNEGIVGVSIFMGCETSTSQAVVQSAGHAYRLPAMLLRAAFNHPGKLQDLLLRFTQSLITHMAQTAVCNRHHTLEQQLCRCLLLRLDRLPSNELVMTQEQIANMLGVRREGITEAAGHLQQAGLIEYRRGHITVLDRTRLEAKVCECYAVVKKESDRLLPEPHPQEIELPRASAGTLPRSAAGNSTETDIRAKPDPYEWHIGQGRPHCANRASS